MGEMEDKINAVLSNPQMMQQIMAMAQAMGGQQSPPPSPQQDTVPGLDISMIQKLSGLARQSGIDKREQTLLNALGGYLSPDRITKLEKAMRAAKMAKFASTLLGPGNTFFSGR